MSRINEGAEYSECRRDRLPQLVGKVGGLTVLRGFPILRAAASAQCQELTMDSPAPLQLGPDGK